MRQQVCTLAALGALMMAVPSMAELPQLISQELRPDSGSSSVEGSGQGDSHQHTDTVPNTGSEDLLEGSGAGEAIQQNKTSPVNETTTAAAVGGTKALPMLEEVEKSVESEQELPEEKRPRKVSYGKSKEDLSAAVCTLDAASVPATAWLRPYRESPSLVLTLPNSRYIKYKAGTLLIVDMGQCWPLAVVHADGCMEVRFGGNYPLKCVDGNFRHGLRPKHKVERVYCGRC